MRHQRPSALINGYIRNNISLWFFGVLAGFFAFVFMIDYMTGLDRYNNKQITQFEIFIFSLAKLPFYAKEMIPFAFYLATMVVISQKMRSLELVVARSLGVSVWGILKPFLSLAAITGVIVICVLDPLSKIAFKQVNAYLAEEYQVTALTDAVGSGAGSGWYAQASGGGFVIVKQLGKQKSANTFQEVIVDFFDDNDRFVLKYRAEQMRLSNQGIQLENSYIVYPDRRTEFQPRVDLPLQIDFDAILRNFSPADELSLYELPGYIRAVEAMGFRTQGYWTQFHKILATPVLYVCMVLLASCFVLRLPRKGGAAVVMALGLVMGFVLYFGINLITALGATGILPPIAAIWIPTGLLAFMPLFWLLSNEDG